MIVWRISIDDARACYGGDEVDGVRLDRSGPVCIFGIRGAGGRVVAVGASIYRGKGVVFKMDYTRPEFRGRGYHMELLHYRIAHARLYGCTHVTATCLSASLPNYLKLGAVVTREYLHGKRVRIAL